METIFTGAGLIAALAMLGEIIRRARIQPERPNLVDHAALEERRVLTEDQEKLSERLAKATGHPLAR